MVSSSARTVDEYLAELPRDRRQTLTELRRIILEHLPPGYEEGMQFGMIGYYIPLSRYPSTYNGQPLNVVALASQKQYMSLYLTTVYGDPAKERALSEAFRKAGKKLDMGKSCVRFTSLDALPLETIAQVVASTSVDDFIALYEAVRSTARAGSASSTEKKTTEDITKAGKTTASKTTVVGKTKAISKKKPVAKPPARATKARKR